MAAVGVLLVTGCALAVLVLWTGSGARAEVLAAARTIPAGHVLEQADLRVVSLIGAEEVSSVPAAAAGDVVGRAAAVPVPAGGLLPADVVRRVGQVLPPAGAVVVSLLVRPGVVPSQAGPGSAVRVLPAPAPSSPAVGGRVPVGAGWEAVLLEVTAASSSEAMVAVSLQVAEKDAIGLTATGGNVVVALLPGPGR